MAYRGTDNLRCYIRESILPPLVCDPSAPPMPPPGHKSHLNHLKVRNESWRNLQHIVLLTESILAKDITGCEKTLPLSFVHEWPEFFETGIDRWIPEESLCVEDEDTESGERLSVPCPPIFDIPPPKLRRPADLSRMSPWIDNLALMTVQRVLHLTFPLTRSWGFHPGNNVDGDRDIFDYYLWTRNQIHPGQNLEVGYESLLVAYQPPWVLSPQDLKEFTLCRTMPPFRLDGHEFPRPLESSERLWAKLWDKCRTINCRWFCVTTYNQWVFGVFTKGWTTGFVTTVYNNNDYSPTILEHLLLWVASAMRLPRTVRIPQVPEPLSSLGLQSIPQTRHADFSTPVPSESNWDGKSKDAGSSAGVDSTLTPLISDAGLLQSPRALDRPKPREHVQAWVEGLMEQGQETPPSLITTVTPRAANMLELTGDWLV